MDKDKQNFFDKTIFFIDSNIRVVRASVYVGIAAGVILLGRRYHLTSVFSKAEDIPAHFIRRRSKLSGHVRDIADDGLLFIEHTPVITLKYLKPKQSSRLPVQLACINITPAGHTWLIENALDKPVWFQLLHRTVQGTSINIYSHVEIRKRFRNIQVNDILVRNGLCSVSTLALEASVKAEISSDIYSNGNLLKYVDRLVKLQSDAKQKKVGIWKETSPVQEKTLARKVFNVVKKLVSSPFVMMKWLYTKAKEKKG